MAFKYKIGKLKDWLLFFSASALEWGHHLQRQSQDKVKTSSLALFSAYLVTFLHLTVLA
jgi:hypothetical protein